MSGKAETALLFVRIQKNYIDIPSYGRGFDSALVQGGLHAATAFKGDSMREAAAAVTADA